MIVYHPPSSISRRSIMNYRKLIDEYLDKADTRKLRIIYFFVSNLF